jgi:hypothetical protein
MIKPGPSASAQDWAFGGHPGILVASGDRERDAGVGR